MNGQTTIPIIKPTTKFLTNLFPPVLNRNYSIEASEYSGKLPEIGSLRLATFTSLNETDGSAYNEYIVVLDKPTLAIRAKSALFYPTQTNRIHLSMQNPLDRPLTNCRLSFKDGGLMCEHKELLLPDEIAPFGRFEHEEQFVPHGHGRSLLVVLLDCDQLHDVRGHLEFTVKRPRNATLTSH